MYADLIEHTCTAIVFRPPMYSFHPVNLLNAELTVTVSSGPSNRCKLTPKHVALNFVVAFQTTSRIF